MIYKSELIFYNVFYNVIIYLENLIRHDLDLFFLHGGL